MNLCSWPDIVCVITYFCRIFLSYKFPFTGRRTPAKKSQPSSLAEAMIMDTEAAVMADLDFLTNPDVDMDDDEDVGDDGDLDNTDDIEEDVKIGKKGK